VTEQPGQPWKRVASTHVPLFDVSVTPLDRDQVVERILAAVRDRQQLVIGNLNLHGVYLRHTDAEFARYCEMCDLVLVDGAPIAAAARLPLSLRVGSTDWLDALLPRAQGLTILAIGSTAESAARAQAHFRQRFPDVEWIGVDGYRSQSVDAHLRSLIARANMVLVGMGMPLQEHWILRNFELLRGKVLANVGGCIDYYAGSQPLAPRWMGRIGLEWLFRFVANPRRLAHRYFVEPFLLGAILIRNMRTRRKLRKLPRGSDR